VGAGSLKLLRCSSRQLDGVRDSARRLVRFNDHASERWEVNSTNFSVLSALLGDNDAYRLAAGREITAGVSTGWPLARIEFSARLVGLVVPRLQSTPTASIAATARPLTQLCKRCSCSRSTAWRCPFPCAGAFPHEQSTRVRNAGAPSRQVWAQTCRRLQTRESAVHGMQGEVETCPHPRRGAARANHAPFRRAATHRRPCARRWQPWACWCPLRRCNEWRTARRP